MSTSHYGKSSPWAIVFFILQIFFVLGYLVDLTSAADRKGRGICPGASELSLLSN